MHLLLSDFNLITYLYIFANYFLLYALIWLVIIYYYYNVRAEHGY